MDKVPVLVGIEGNVEGARTALEYGKTIVVGRSRSADFSLRRMPAVMKMTDEEREQDHDLRTVSGRHFEITMYNLKSVEIVNLSPNGTFVDGKMVDKIILEDVAERPHEIRIGTKEVFTLEMGEPPSSGAPASAGKPEETGEESGPKPEGNAGDKPEGDSGEKPADVPAGEPEAEGGGAAGETN